MKSLYERDQHIQKIEQLIKNRKTLLREIYTTIHNSTEENHYLIDIVNDYKNYYHDLKNQKNKQLESLVKLQDYVYHVIENKNNLLLDKDGINQAKQDRNIVDNKIKNIKKELDIINNIKL